MKKLENYQIIYDDECPLCNVYTRAFIDNGMLDKNGRVPYKEYIVENKFNVDIQKSQNQIALVNTKTGETTYGLDSMLKIITHRFNFVKNLFKIKIIYWLFTKLYSFISFNRKVIAPAKITAHTCKPEFNTKYRILFIVFCWLVTSLVLQAFTSTFHFKHYPNYIESILLLVQIPVQYLILKNKSKENFINYLGHLFFLSLLGSLLLLPIICFNYFIAVPLIISAVYFFAIVLLLVIMHLKRVALLQLNNGLCYSWILYRLSILAIIIIANYL